MASYLQISSVAVIGAGISGVVAAAHLKRKGLSVTVYERNHDSGGVWLFDERLPPEPVYPSVKPSLGENTQNRDERNLSLYAPPGPAYSSLMNNVATGLLETSLLPWPKGTPPIVKHSVLKEYIQSISKTTGVHEFTRYNTRVLNLQKAEGQWSITSETQHSKGGPLIRENNIFDAVVVASGHYHAPRIPDKPGLKQWKENWPERVFHSKSYRYPDKFKGKNVLIMGAGVSSLDIAKDIGPIANKIWQTSRGGDYDLPGSLLPENAVQVPDTESFELPHDGESKTLGEDEPIPLTVTLGNGRKICDIHYVIIATGYHITLPFLSYLHQDDVKPEEIDDKTIVSDGTMFHNLHKDIFYIPDPTLSFIGVPYYTATFSLFDFQAKLLALVYSGQVGIPSSEKLRAEYIRRVHEKGLGRAFNSLRGKEEEYVAELADWADPYLAEKGEAPFGRHTDLWLSQKEEQRIRIGKLLEGPPFDPAITEAALAAIACS